MRQSLAHVFEYFDYFGYAPTLTEIYTFFPKKIARKNLSQLISQEVIKGTLKHLPNKGYFRVSGQALDTVPQYSIITPKTLKLSIKIFLSFLRHCPFIRFVGITGASAMVGKRENDDLDLCVITQNQLLWTSRLIAILCAKLLRIHTKNGVCLNLFLDEEGLIIPEKKHNLYIAHEILQMKPLIDKNDTYRRFIFINKWIYRYFPNAKTSTKTIVKTINTAQKRRVKTLYILMDNYFKSIQLPIIQRNKTALFISPVQLWLFKKDFEKKLKRHGLVI